MMYKKTKSRYIQMNSNCIWIKRTFIKPVMYKFNRTFYHFEFDQSYCMPGFCGADNLIGCRSFRTSAFRHLVFSRHWQFAPPVRYHVFRLFRYPINFLLEFNLVCPYLIQIIIFFQFLLYKMHAKIRIISGQMEELLRIGENNKC